MSGRLPLAICLAAALVAGCAPPRPRLQGSVAVVVEPEERGLPTDWKSVATTADADALARIGVTWALALSAARSPRFAADIKREGLLLDPAAALVRPAPPPGTYHCRVIRLGQRGKAYAAFKPFYCFVQAEGSLLTFVKGTGTHRPAGRLWDDGETRMVFLGSVAEGIDTSPLPYGSGPASNQIGIVERVADFRWRMVLPMPEGPARIDVIELIPDTPPPPLAPAS